MGGDGLVTAFLLDTNAVLWLTTAPNRIAPQVRHTLADPTTDLRVSGAAAWEVAIKTRIGRLAGGPLLSAWDETLAAMNATNLPIDSADAIVAGQLNWAHKDPFDRMLVAQAVRRGLTIHQRQPHYRRRTHRSHRAATIMSTNSIHDNEWHRNATWYTRDLTAEQVAHYLDESGDPLVADFFAAHHSEYDQRWSLADIYTHMASRHPDRAEYRIPRLFPLTTPTGPARLLHTQPAHVDALQAEFVVHAWNPRDDRGPIAIAYPVRDCPSAMTPEAAATLLGTLTWASAVAVLSGQDPTQQLSPDAQPGVWVADGAVPEHRSGVRVTTNHHPWGDLANLLRTALPWWPPSLRDRDAILAWTPESEPRQIRPATTEFEPDALHRLLTLTSSHTLRDIIAAAATNAEYSLARTYLTQHGYTGDYTDDYPENAGLTKAATATRNLEAKGLTDGEAALILHQPAPDHSTAWAAIAVLRGVPVAHNLYTVDAELAQHPLAQAWLAQLIPTAQPLELGFYLPAARMADNTTEPAQ
ncbi:MAG: type II toxin-antitoxin system VapC family toxin, partial [Dietzia sp.]|nr:type II toxin-antitoxin system VapC family toxin [Dietzia sp.]